MRVLLTGAEGAIGRAVLAALVAAGHRVLALTGRGGATAALAGAGARPVTGELAEAGEWLPGLDPDGVIHLADPRSRAMAAADAAFVEALIAHAPGARVVRAGSLWLYGMPSRRHPRTIREGDRLDPPVEMRWMAAAMARLKQAGMHACIVHPAMVWQEDGDHGVLGPWIAAARAGEAPEIHGAPPPSWPMIHLDDLADLFVEAVGHGTPGAVYHGVAEPAVSTLAMASAIARALYAPEPVVTDIGSACRRFGAWARCLGWSQRMTAEATREALSWAPRRPGVLETIARAA
ncbi:MAG: 3-beta hydroxysteroid dehydrogenase [Paracoccaceae bacterium]|nr:MAG: 3-beta hydroxysteroid dehydrogenase [Paracoccaceae bacterium]